MLNSLVGDFSGPRNYTQTLNHKIPCRIIITSNISITNPITATYDSITLNSGDRVLINGQTNKTENGIYFFY